MVEAVADGLHLRQNKAAFGRFKVYRHNQYDGASGRRQIAQQRRRMNKIFRNDFQQSRLKAIEHFGTAVCIGRVYGNAVAVGGQNVRFVKNFDYGQLPCRRLVQNLLFIFADAVAFANQNNDIAAFKNGTGFRQTGVRQSGFVAKTGGI